MTFFVNPIRAGEEVNLMISYDVSFVIFRHQTWDSIWPPPPKRTLVLKYPAGIGSNFNCLILDMFLEIYLTRFKNWRD